MNQKIKMKIKLFWVMVIAIAAICGLFLKKKWIPGGDPFEIAQKIIPIIGLSGVTVLGIMLYWLCEKSIENTPGAYEKFNEDLEEFLNFALHLMGYGFFIMLFWVALILGFITEILYYLGNLILPIPY